MLQEEESLDRIQGFVTARQREAEALSGGFTLDYKEEQFDFIPTFVDR